MSKPLELELQERYGPGEPARRLFAPGRINLIGEHVDYHGGVVLPTAIDRGITANWRPSEGNLLRLASRGIESTLELNLAELPAPSDYDDWRRYPVAVFVELRRKGFPLAPFEALLTSDLPRGSGLSSSACLSVLCAELACRAARPSSLLSAADLAALCQRSERAAVGVSCGIMDPFAIAASRAGHALLIDCERVQARPIPLPKQARLVVIDSRSPRSLASSAYNQRLAEGQEALRIIAEARHIARLSEARVEDLPFLEDPLIRRRARHVVEEIARVHASVACLQAGDLRELGLLLDASHASLRDNYDVSSPALEHCVQSARRAPGCFGARLTGAGFGGCALALVASDQVQSFQAHFEAEPTPSGLRQPRLMICRTCDGVTRRGPQRPRRQSS